MDQITPPTRGFEISEFEKRTKSIQRSMFENKLDLLLLTNEHHFRYFSGFLSQFWESPTRPWFLLVPLEGRPIAVIPEIGRSGLEGTWIEEIYTWSAPCPDDDGVSLLFKVIKENSSKFSRIGLAQGHETHLRMPLKDYCRLKNLLYHKEMIDCHQLMKNQLVIKSSAEISKIKYACDIVGQAFDNLPNHAKIGLSERQICRKMTIEILENGLDRSPYLISASGYGGYDNIIMGPTDRVLNEGDILIIDTGSTFDGYFCDFDRNFGFFNTTIEAKKAYETVYTATEAAFKLARPGVTTSDLWHKMWGILEKGGAIGNDVGRLGHGLGMQLTEWPSITPNDGTVLKEGMVITLEPGMTFLPGKQMVHEENIVITADGAKWLTKRAKQELPIIS